MKYRIQTDGINFGIQKLQTGFWRNTWEDEVEYVYFLCCRKRTWPTQKKAADWAILQYGAKAERIREWRTV